LNLNYFQIKKRPLKLKDKMLKLFKNLLEKILNACYRAHMQRNDLMQSVSAYVATRIDLPVRWQRERHADMFADKSARLCARKE
jgi:hypothetical protein